MTNKKVERQEAGEKMAFDRSDIEVMTPLKPTNTSEAFAVILNSVGDFGLWQWKLVVITGFIGLFTGLHNFSAVFLAANPDHWCQIPHMEANASYTRQMQNITTPWVKGRDGDMVPSKCTYYSNSVEMIDGDYTNGPSVVSRCSSWYYDTSTYQSTVVSEWDLVCDRRWLMSTAQSSFQIGILVGAVLFSGLSDRWGRRKVSLICAGIFFVSSILVSFSTSYTTFLLVRFIVAGSGQGIFLINYVLLMECLGLKGRTVLGNVFHVWFTIGFSLLSLLAYFIRDWSNLQLCISVPSILLLLYYWFLPESPRWLMMQGRFKEALTYLAGIAKTNKKKLPSDRELDDLMVVIKNEGEYIEEPKGALEKIRIIWDSVLVLVRTPNMRSRNLIIFYAWFVTAMMYYGLAFNGPNLNASAYLNVFLSGAVELPAILLTILSLLKFGRRPVLFLTLTFSGLACLGIAFVPKRLVWLNITLSSIGKGLSSSAFFLVFMFSAELVPTNVRNISIGIASFWGRLGSAIAPYIVDLLGDVYYAMPSTIFGVSAIIAGLLVLLLPETGNKGFPESVQEIESLPR